MAWISKNDYLSMEEMENNAKEFHRYFIAQGWTPNAIAGMLGNVQTESFINPGIWESLIEGNLDGGYGLVQWTPATKYIDWAGSNYADGTRQCDRIIYEIENGIQWYSTPEYPLSFEEFSKSTESPRYLAMAFINNYERPLDTNQPIRGDQAEYWYKFLEGEDPNPPGKGDYLIIKPFYYSSRDELWGRRILGDKRVSMVNQTGDRCIVKTSKGVIYETNIKNLKKL